MSNKTDLDWLARNVHVWPEGRREVLVCCTRNVDTLIWSSVLSDAGWITKDQWLARRAELASQFKPLTSIEDNQEQVMTQQKDMKQDNKWFERGELPPVGTVCLYVVSDRLSAEVEITAHAKFGLCFVEVGKSGENYVSKTAELHRFRPVRTERDVLLSIIVEEMNRYDTDGKLADAILAAGFSLRDK